MLQLWFLCLPVCLISNNLYTMFEVNLVKINKGRYLKKVVLLSNSFSFINLSYKLYNKSEINALYIFEVGGQTDGLQLTFHVNVFLPPHHTFHVDVCPYPTVPFMLMYALTPSYLSC